MSPRSHSETEADGVFRTRLCTGFVATVRSRGFARSVMLQNLALLIRQVNGSMLQKAIGRAFVYSVEDVLAPCEMSGSALNAKISMRSASFRRGCVAERTSRST